MGNDIPVTGPVLIAAGGPIQKSLPAWPVTEALSRVVNVETKNKEFPPAKLHVKWDSQKIGAAMTHRERTQDGRIIDITIIIEIDRKSPGALHREHVVYEGDVLIQDIKKTTPAKTQKADHLKYLTNLKWEIKTLKENMDEMPLVYFPKEQKAVLKVLNYLNALRPHFHPGVPEQRPSWVI